MSYDASDDLVYNPFAEDDSPRSESNLAQGYYSSAFFPKLGSSSPTLRRRRSSLTDKPSIKPKESRRKHVRSHTELDIAPRSAGLHPLKSALLGTIGAVFLENPDVTRPHLSRIVNDGILVDAEGTEDDDSAEPTPLPADQEKQVIVHKVTPKDSLAGVSLKYGISMAHLRRANQLWTSDSIHRKGVLYIPVDQATRAREYIREPDLISLTPEPPTDSRDVFEDTSTLPVNGDKAHSLPTSPTVPILRVPSRQLSYFPPSSNKHPDVKHHGHADGDSSHLQPSPNSKASFGTSRYNPSQPNHSLSSILTALPIAASTRDEIITRLSFDSVSSSFTDRSRANSDEETGHEMNDVAKRKRRSRHENGVPEDVDELSMPTPKASSRPQQQRGPTQGVPTDILSSSLPKHFHARSLSSTSPPRFYVSQANETFVRTSQLEPSPAMQLPNFHNQTFGRSSGKGLQGNLAGGCPQLPSVTPAKTPKTERRKDGELGLMMEQMQVNGM